MQKNPNAAETAKDFTEEDVVLLKEMLLSLEAAIDEIVIGNTEDGETFEGAYMFKFLGQANVR